MRFSALLSSMCLTVTGIIAAPVSSQGFTISTPKLLSQCSPATISWTSTNGPYTIQVLESSLPYIFSIDQEMFTVPSNRATWIVDLPVGTSITIVVRDASGQIAESESKVVGEGSSECLDDDFVI